ETGAGGSPAGGASRGGGGWRRPSVPGGREGRVVGDGTLPDVGLHVGRERDGGGVAAGALERRGWVAGVPDGRSGSLALGRPPGVLGPSRQSGEGAWDACGAGGDRKRSGGSAGSS